MFATKIKLQHTLWRMFSWKVVKKAKNICALLETLQFTVFARLETLAKIFIHQFCGLKSRVVHIFFTTPMLCLTLYQTNWATHYCMRKGAEMFVCILLLRAISW